MPTDGKTVVMVSGTFDLLHAGHIQFLNDAKALGDYLIVVLPTDDTVRFWKKREPALPLAHKLQIFGNLRMVDEVLVGSGQRYVEPAQLNFMPELRGRRPNILAVTEDDTGIAAKRAVAQCYGTELVVLPKTASCAAPRVSATQMRRNIVDSCPARVDFAGGWLDVPANASEFVNGYVVNCTITPLVTLVNNPYRPGGGVGGSAIAAILADKDALRSELDAGAGWQDPAVLAETGLCVWAGGKQPQLILKTDGAMLRGVMSLQWSGNAHSTPELVSRPRNLQAIADASRLAIDAVRHFSFMNMAQAVHRTYQQQLDEGMAEIRVPPGVVAVKYCGAGHGGYILQLWRDANLRRVHMPADAFAIEPYYRDRTQQ